MNTSAKRCQGQRSTYQGLFPPGDPEAASAARQAAARLTQMAGTVPLETPWTAPQATAWDQHTLHQWLAAHVGLARARTALTRAIEGVCASGPGGTSLLAALFGIHAGDALGPFVAAQAPDPAHRCAGGAQQLASRMAAALGERVRLDAWVSHITHHATGVQVTAGPLEVRARRAILAMAPAMAGRVRYTPALPVARDQLTQRTPMDWVITVHCVYPTRFWRDDGLSGQVTSDAGAVRVTADTSPPADTPGVLVGFIAGAAARRLAAVTRAERLVAVLADLVRYFGPRAAVPWNIGSTRGGRTSSRAGPLRAPGPQASGLPMAMPCGRPSGCCTGLGRKWPRSGRARWKAHCGLVRGRLPRCWRPWARRATRPVGHLLPQK